MAVTDQMEHTHSLIHSTIFRTPKKEDELYDVYCTATISQMDYLAPLQMDFHPEMTRMHEWRILNFVKRKSVGDASFPRCVLSVRWQNMNS